MAPRGVSPAHASAGPAGPAQQDTIQLRNATNFRSVSRNDPALVEILDTSNYSVIYHYDAAGEKWEKQKQEGPLFVVRRSKAPEYALYMLNRLAVKNVTIPLIPGEMKATAIDASMLQVARRGEKIRYGIWFTEGAEAVQRFRESIVRAVGEPSKQGMASARDSPAPGTASSQPASGDGLSRLFAGLTTVPASKPSSQSPQPVQPVQPVQPPVQTVSQPPYAPQAPYASHSPYSQPSSQPHYPQPPPQPAHHYTTNSAPFTGPQAPYQHYSNAGPPSDAPSPQPPVQAPQPPSFAPGQTVDDLLKGILGPSMPSSAAIAPLGPSPPLQPASSTGAAPQISPPLSNTSPVRSPPGLMPMQAQAKRGHAQRGSISSPRRGPDPGQGQGPSHGFPSPPKQPQLPSPQQQQPMMQQAPPLPGVMRDALVTTFAPDGARPPPVPKEALVGTLIHLLQTNPAFGDDVWKAYLARCGP